MGNSGGGRRAFTLIELLVVIAIIAILATLLIPELSKIIDRAKVAHTKANIASLRTALEGYRTTYVVYPDDGMDKGGVVNSALAVIAQGGCSTLTSGECLVYFLGNIFKTSPNTSKGEVGAARSGGGLIQYPRNQLKDYDVDIPAAGSKKAIFAGEEFVDTWNRRFHYDNLIDDPNPNGATDKTGVVNSGATYVGLVGVGQTLAISDPRPTHLHSDGVTVITEGQNIDTFDIWSTGPDPLITTDDVSNWTQ